MDRDDNSPSEQQEPFWDSAQAQEDTTPAQSEPQTVSVPQGQIMGDLAQQPQTHFSATVNNPAQYSSASSITTGYDMSEKKKGMNWKQFAIGFFAPIVIMMLLTTLSEFANGDWDDRWDDVHQMEMITMSSDNGTFTHTFDGRIADDQMKINWCYSLDTYEGHQYHCEHSYQQGGEIIEIVEENTDTGYEIVGEYNEKNHTIWFTTDSHSIDEIRFEFEFYDRALQEELDNSMANEIDAEDLFCFVPLIGIVAIVVSFAKGNKSLGIGLITSIIGIPFALFTLFFLLLMMFGF